MSAVYEPSSPIRSENPVLVAKDAVVELSEHGIVVIVEESGCLQAKVYLKSEVRVRVPARCLCLFLAALGDLNQFYGDSFLQLFVEYDYAAEGRPRFGLSLGLLVDCLNMFSVPGCASSVEIRYPGPDMQLLLKYVSSLPVFSVLTFAIHPLLCSD
jgi:cell cycle checkpoint protein